MSLFWSSTLAAALAVTGVLVWIWLWAGRTPAARRWAASRDFDPRAMPLVALAVLYLLPMGVAWAALWALAGWTDEDESSTPILMAVGALFVMANAFLLGALVGKVPRWYGPRWWHAVRQVQRESDGEQR
ncbi:MAG: hypothetical protein IPJ14_14885 [Kineosporiaceae bacterium]|nr:hypothetical protein [Kineosporiaceae bacterium]MBK7623903.1 hypothetical protein [Kineosporiaceae bacterium]